MSLRFVLGVLIPFCLALSAGADLLPVREVTVFKDGHALLLREGKMPVSPEGTATLDQLPAPVLGTFWPYAKQRSVTLTRVTAGVEKATAERDILSLRDLFAANVGGSVTIRENVGSPAMRTFSAKILSLPAPPTPEPGNPFAPESRAIPADPGIVLLETDDGIIIRRIEQLFDVTFPGGARRRIAEETIRNRMTLHLSGARDSAEVGVLYLQRGLRWIPSYRVTIDGKGAAQIQLQATLVNELIDLNDATVNLVIGTPSFAFKDTPDPIGLQDAIARLSRYFEGDARTPGALSNSIMTQQVARMGEYGGPRGADAGPSPGGVESGKAEDLFVFTIPHLSLKRYERMTLPVATYSIAYRDVYTLELLPTPTRNQNGAYDSAPTGEMARLLAQPKVMHKLRLANASKYPLTTAPALLFVGDRLLAQSLMTYTPAGGTSDLTLTAATDITVKRSDKETGRTPNAFQSDGYQYWRVDLAGQVELCNYGAAPAEVEATRYVLGAVDSASNDGVVSPLDPLLDNDLPSWLGQYSNFGDRLRFTGLGRIAWKSTLPPGGKTCITLTYQWHYFTR